MRTALATARIVVHHDTRSRRVNAPLPSKTALKDELVRILAADLDVRERAHKAALEGATHEEAKPENDKDTRALEQSYLARGEAARVEEMREGLVAVKAMGVRAIGEGEPVTVGALVATEQQGASVVLLLAPSGGGTRLAGGAVQVVTPQSPLGRALLGKRTGDDFELVVGGRSREISVLSVE
jgi:transcription elongation GreA/GreB family factor